MRYLDLRTNQDFCSDSCSRCKEQRYWNMPSLAKLFCNQVKKLHGQSRSENFKLPQGQLWLVKTIQSLPGPDSGDSSSSRLLDCKRALTAKNNKTPVDVRVEGPDGQQPPGAHQANPLQLDKNANHFDHSTQFVTPQGILVRVSYKSQLVTYTDGVGIAPCKSSSAYQYHNVVSLLRLSQAF